MNILMSTSLDVYNSLSVYRDSLEYILSETTTCFEKCGLYIYGKYISNKSLHRRHCRLRFRDYIQCR